MLDLHELLSQRFGHATFRPYQAAVCEAAAAGADVLLVMPTGAGKSLCYQLPGVARGGVTLVISPLIALMEDQAQKLLAQGFRAARIHSGVSRENARAACRAYLDGTIDFLFIAPERMRVPGFPEMLAKRKPALIAVDEAHCISQWGHDFRPDYRMLRAHLAALRPSPIIALTATATPAVQEDIVRELDMRGVRRFIHGFRRENIGVEVCEQTPKDRVETALDLLERPERRPAIVYAGTRKAAKEIAERLPAKCRAASYHAGMTPSDRDRVQRAFLSGECETIVATIAFGMGVDKPDVRTVIHLALPGSVEGYYQEIGRAGRDGKPSRALLLHSYQDVKTHEFFFGRDYPEPKVLADIMGQLARGPTLRETLQKKLQLEADTIEKALEKLWMFGALTEDADGVLSALNAIWQKPYETQRSHRWEQVERMQRFASTAQCRMAALVMHFGDSGDAARPCGACDVCAPKDCIVHMFRTATAQEEAVAAFVRQSLRAEDGPSTGQLFRALPPGISCDRRAFDQVLHALVQRGELRLSQDQWMKDGRTIVFHRAWLGSAGDADALPLSVAERTKKTSRKERAPRKPRDRSSRASARDTADAAVVSQASAPAHLVEALRTFRRTEAARTKMPAFRILTDRVLLGIAARAPASLDELQTVSGVGPSIANKYGRQLLEIVATHGQPA